MLKLLEPNLQSADSLPWGAFARDLYDNPALPPPQDHATRLSDLEISQNLFQAKNKIHMEEIAHETGVRIAAFSEPFPGEKVSGDFYSVFRAPSGKVWCFVGDVCGHGPAAAEVSVALNRFMASAHFQDALCKLDDPIEILGYIDHRFSEIPENSFMTLDAFLVDPVKGSILYGSGGMPPPVVIRDGFEVECIPGRGTILGAGLYPPRNKISTEIHASKGDTLVVWSDGVSDLPSHFGDRTLESAVIKNPSILSHTALTPRDTLRHIENLVDDSRPSPNGKDDRTLFVVQF